MLTPIVAWFLVTILGIIFTFKFPNVDIFLDNYLGYSLLFIIGCYIIVFISGAAIFIYEKRYKQLLGLIVGGLLSWLLFILATLPFAEL